MSNICKCGKCGVEFNRNYEFKGKKYFLQRRKYCLTCSPFKGHNTKTLEINPKEIRTKEGYLVCNCNICNKDYTIKQKHGYSKQICHSCRCTIRRYKLKKQLVEYKGGQCEVCGYNKNLRNLVFHHIDPNEKEFNLSGNVATRSFDELKIEADKCKLVCHHCHNDIHDELHGTAKRMEKYLNGINIE